MKQKQFLLSWLSVLLWLIISSMFVNPLRIYLSPILTHYYNISLSTAEIQFITTNSILSQIIALMLSILLSYSIKRTIQRHLIFSALYTLLLATSLLIISSNTLILSIGLFLFSFGVGLLIAPTITSICSRMYLLNTIWEPEIITKDSHSLLLSYQKVSIVNSINIVFILPMTMGIVLLTKSLFIAYIVFFIICTFSIYTLHKYPEFGAFHCLFSFKQFVKNTIANSMFWYIVMMTLLILVLEFCIMYTLPHFLYSAYSKTLSPQDIENLQILIFIIVSLIRITIMIFITTSINKLLPRRIILFSCITVSILIMLYQYVDTHIKVFILIAILIGSSAILPMLLKSTSNFIKLSMLPFSIAILSIIGNYGFQILYYHLQNRIQLIIFLNSYSYWYIFIAIIILFFALLFFINAHRKNLHLISLDISHTNHA